MDAMRKIFQAPASQGWGLDGKAGYEALLYWRSMAACLNTFSSRYRATRKRPRLPPAFFDYSQTSFPRCLFRSLKRTWKPRSLSGEETFSRPEADPGGDSMGAFPLNEPAMRFMARTPPGPGSEISKADCSREYPPTSCAGVSPDDVVLRVLESPALWAGNFTSRMPHSIPCSLFLVPWIACPFPSSKCREVSWCGVDNGSVLSTQDAPAFF